jgi:hypothetical protein
MADNLNIKTKLMQHINSFDYQYSEQNTHIRLYLKLVLTYVHFG